MSPLRVAIVNPNAQARAELRAILESVGHTVYEAHDRDGAFQAASDVHPEAFLVEADLAADAHTQQQPLVARATGPIVLLTEERSHAAADIDRFSRLGAFATLSRPWRSTELLMTVSVATERFRDLRDCNDTVSKLETRLADRIVIERAKGYLMRVESLSEEAAFKRIHFAARNANRPMRAVAEEILAQAEAASAAAVHPENADAAPPAFEGLPPQVKTEQ